MEALPLCLYEGGRDGFDLLNAKRVLGCDGGGDGTAVVPEGTEYL